MDENPIYESQYTIQQIEDSIGKTPIIDPDTKEWKVWDIATSAYVGTGVIAESETYAEAAAASAQVAQDYADNIADPVGGIVAQWIADNLSQETGYVIDNSLTVQGAAADAKAVGDKLSGALTYRGTANSSMDLNSSTFTVGGQWYCASGNYPANFPFTSGAGRIVTLGSNNNMGGKIQLAFSASGDAAFRYRTSSSWYSWKYLINSNTFANYLDSTLTDSTKAADAKAAGDKITALSDVVMQTRESLTAGADLNDFKSTGMYFCNALTSISNSPFASGTRFDLIVKGLRVASATGGCSQIAITGDTFAVRTYYQSSWKAWQIVKSADISANFDFTMMTRTLGTITALSDLTSSGMYYIPSSSTYADKPIPTSFALLVKGGTTSSATSGQMQIAVGNGVLAWRHRLSGSWSDWTLTTGEPLFDFSVVESFAVCGGSYDSGYSYSPGGTAETHESKAWPKIAAREHGNTAMVYARHGLSISDWYSSQYGYQKMIADDPVEVYICTFGANDYADYSIGTVADAEAYIADPTITPTTFYGWYAKLLTDIKAHAPSAKIVLTSPASEEIILSSSTSAELIAAIKNIASLFGTAYFRWRDDVIIRTQLANYCTTGSSSNPHPTAMGYSLMAQRFKLLFAKCVAEYSSYFADFGF